MDTGGWKWKPVLVAKVLIISRAIVSAPRRTRHRGHHGRLDRQLHRRARGAHQSPSADPVRREKGRAPVLGAARLRAQDLCAPRPARRLPRPVRHAALPQLLLLLVGELRRAVAGPAQQHEPEQPGHQLLGRRPERAGVLADELPERSCQAAHHDRSPWWRARRWRQALCQVARCCGDGVSRIWVEGVLEGILAVLFEGVSGECHGLGGF